MGAIEAIRIRRSIKSFKNHTITKDEINQILEAAILSPTYNIQNWKFVIVTEQKLKDAMCQLSYGQKQVAEASLVIVLCADLKAWEKNPELYWKNISEESRIYLVNGITQAYGNPKLEKDPAIRFVILQLKLLCLQQNLLGMIAALWKALIMESLEN